MNPVSIAMPEPVALDIDDDLYARLRAALSGLSFPHTYRAGRLEIESPVLEPVSWQQYDSILAAFGDRKFRHVYDQGELEIMAPLRDHDRVKKLIARLVETLAFELDIPMSGEGSSTIRRMQSDQGIEPDESYYIQHEHLVRERRELDFNVDPPPDLAIEIDVTSNSRRRYSVYAALGVPEIWRHDGEHLRMLARTPEGAYVEISRSIALPLLTPGEIERFLAMEGQTDQTSIVRAFARWIRSQQQP